jgi:hypothetical protein
MIGGWRPWERWYRWHRWSSARRLALHARRESGAPPPDLLRRLREDIPALPAMTYQPAAARDERRAAPRRWLLAASLAAALTGGVLGLRVWQVRSRAEMEAAPPAAAAYAAPTAGTPAAGAPAGTPAAAPTATAPATAAATDTAGLKREALAENDGSPVAEPARAVPPASVPPPPPPRAATPTAASAPAPKPSPSMFLSAGSPGAATPGPRQPAGQSVMGAAGVTPRGSATPEKTAANAAGGVSQPHSATAGDADGAHGAADETVVTSESAPVLDQMHLPDSETARPAAASHRPQPAAPKVAAPQDRPAEETAAAERAGKAAPRAAAVAAPPPATAAPLRSSFGADTGTDSYRRVRRGLLDEGRLPRAASVRADELANAFDLAAEMPAVGRPELTVEGAPLPAAGAVYLLRFQARGLVGPSSADAVEVDFDPAVVASFRRVGATVNRGVASALYQIELRPAAGHAASDRPAVTAAPPGNGPTDRVIATLRVVSRERINVGGNENGRMSDYAGPHMPEAGRVVRLSQLRPSWEAASPALRAQGVAVQFAQALAAKDPAPRLQELLIQARTLAAELPDDPKAAELLELVERAAELARAPRAAAPGPPL